MAVSDEERARRQRFATYNPKYFLEDLHEHLRFRHAYSFKRDDMLRRFFPEPVQESLQRTSVVYLSHFLACNPTNAARNKEYYRMTECDPREMIRQTVEMVERFFADPDVSFDEQKIQDFLKSRKDDIPAFSSALDRDGCGGDCSMTETDTARLCDAYVLCIDRNWKLCIAKLLVTLSTGQFATVDLLNQIWMYDNAGTSILHTPIPGSAPLPAVIRDAVFKHQYGDATAKKEAYAQLYDYAAKIKRPKTIEDARALYTLGRWLYFGEGCKQSRTEGLALIERACADDTLILRDAHLFLARFYRDEADPQKAKAHLQTAANAGSVDAMQEYAVALFRADASFACDKDLLQALDLLQSAIGKADVNPAQKAVLYYYCGRICEERDETLSEDARRWYEEAARRGDEDAMRRLNRRRWQSWRTRAPAGSRCAIPRSSICVTNGNTGFNPIFTDSLPDKAQWTFFSIAPGGDDIADVIRQILSLYNDPSADYPVVPIALLSADENRNIRDAVEVLIRLYEDVALQLTDPNARMSLMENVTLYIRARSEYAALPIDALISSMDNSIYFKTVFCDYPLDCARELLMQHPLFLPAFRQHAGGTDLVIVGGDTIALPLIKEILSCANGNVFCPSDGSEYTMRITVVSAHADEMREQLFCDCPAIRQAFEKKKDKALHIPIHFIVMDTQDADIRERICETGANYFVVDLGSDDENLLYATQLRGWTLQADATFTNLPQIAVLCRSERTAMLSQAYTVGSFEHGNAWYNGYDLITFGVETTHYTFAALTESSLRHRAEAAHCHYARTSLAGKDDLTSRQALHEELHTFYSRYYFRDSSAAEVIGLLYRAFSAGAVSEDHLVTQTNALAEIADRFDALLSRSGEDFCEKLGRAEHLRWCGFMYARGWQRASAEQTITYLSLGNPKQQCFICKLHPYLCDWDELDKVHDLLLRYAKSEDVRERLATPKAYDIGSVQKTAAVLRQNDSILP